MGAIVQKLLKSSMARAGSRLINLGLVAGLIDEIEIVDKINQLVGEQPGERVTPGHAVKAMIFNRLGLSTNSSKARKAARDRV